MASSHGFTWLGTIPGLEHAPSHVVHLGLIGTGLIGASLVARAQLKRVMARPDSGLIPEERITFRNFFEMVTEQLHGFVEGVLGKHLAHHYYPVVGSTFFAHFNL